MAAGDKGLSFAMYRTRESLSELKDGDVTLGVYKVLEAMFNCLELMSMQASSNQAMAVPFESLLEAVSADQKQKKEKSATSVKDVDKITGQYL